MIDWLFQATIETSLVIVLVLLTRNPFRRLFGAHIAYALWVLPLLKLLIPFQLERPTVVTRYVDLPNTHDLLPVYTSPTLVNNDYIQLIFWLWLAGILIFSIFMLINSLKFHQLIKNNSRTCQLKINSGLLIKYCSWIKGPIISGLFKPTVYLPIDFEDRYSTIQQKLILKHELMHAKRLDLWAQLLFELFRICFWFNPLVHLATSKFQLDQELSCDYQVLKKTDTHTRIEYGKAMKNNLSAVLSPHVLNFFHHKHERFIMLSKHKSNKITTLSGLLFGLVVAYPVFTQTSISLEEKSVKTHGTVVSYEFNDIPLMSVVMLISESVEGVNDLQGLELLQGINVTAKAEKVYAFDFLDTLLKEHGLKVDRQQGAWQFSKI